MTGHIIIFLIVAIVLLLIGVPVAATLGLSSILFFVLEGIPAMTVVQRLFSGCDVAALMCIPFFILAGDLMAKGGIAKRLVNVCNMAIGNVTGGLALVTIVVCAIFAAMTGSAMACCVTIGAIMLPYMLEAGYSREFSTAVFSAGAVLGPIIPAIDGNDYLRSKYKRISDRSVSDGSSGRNLYGNRTWYRGMVCLQKKRLERYGAWRKRFPGKISSRCVFESIVKSNSGYRFPGYHSGLHLFRNLYTDRISCTGCVILIDHRNLCI